MNVLGSLAIAVTSFPYEGKIISETIFDNFMKQYPGIAADVIYRSSGDALAALYEDVVDVSIVLGRVKMERFVCTKLFESELRVAVSKLHPLAEQCYVSFSDLMSYPIAKSYDIRCCHQEIAARFERINFSPRFIDLSSSIENCNRFLKEDNGIIFVSYSPSLHDSYPDTDFIPLDKSERITIPVCIAWRQGNKEKLILRVQKSLTQSLRDERRMFQKDKMEQPLILT
jgi:DNA-binding transcriptional LysR family regulator